MEYEQYKDIYLETVSVILILTTVKYVPDICIWHVYIVGNARMNVICFRTSFVVGSVRYSIL